MVAMNQVKDSSTALASSSSVKERNPEPMEKDNNRTSAPGATQAITASFSETIQTTISASSTPQASPFSTPSNSTPSSPSLPAKESHPPIPKKSSKLPTKCPLEKCLLCSRDQPLCLMRSSTWPAIMRVVFYTLKYNNPEKEFFNLKDDVYAVMLFHWNKLAIHKKSASNWKKHIQDMLSHSKDIFESGLEIYGQNGYWRLKTNTDPWTLSGKTRRSPKKGLALKRPLEDLPSAEQMPRRPFIPYIAKGSTGMTMEAAKFSDGFQQPVSYVFINEHSSPPLAQQAGAPLMGLRKESDPIPGTPTTPTSSSGPSTPVFPNPFMQQRFPFMPGQFPQSLPTSPSFPSSPQLQTASPSLHSFIHSRLAISLPSSRLPSPQRSRSPSPLHTHSLPTSPRSINNPLFPSFSPFSAPASPSSSRASPYISTQPSSASSTRPSSPSSLPMSPDISPPASPPRGRAIRALRSPPSPQSPISPLSPQEDSALDNLRSTFEQFHWHTHAQVAQAQAHAQAHAHAQQHAQAQQLESHQIAFNLFASAKPANPCDVSFLLNE